MIVSTTPAYLIEELVRATGLSRQSITDTISNIADAISDNTSILQQRTTGIMAKSSSLESKFDEVTDIADENLDRKMKVRIAGALGFGVLGGLVLASATEIISMLVGVVLILLAGFLIKDMLKLVIDRLSRSLDTFTL